MVFGALYRAGQLECFTDIKVQNFSCHLMLFFCVFFFGGGGGGGAGELGLQTQTSLFPSLTSVVFLNYGTNDLAANVPPLQAAVKVFEQN